MSTAFNPQTDGQTERFNAVMEQYLRSYVNYLQDDCSSWLPLAEFAANNHSSDATQLSPFFALHGYHPRATTNLVPTTEPTPGDPDALASATALEEIHDFIRTEINRAQVIQAEGGDQRRIPAPVFRLGDRVWLDARNIKIRRPTKKLDHRRLGPYEVMEMVGPNAVRLRLPDTVSVDHGSTNRGGSHGPHRTASVRFVSWRTANRPATARFGFLANRTTNRAVPRHGFSNRHSSPQFATVRLFTCPYFSLHNFVKYF